MRYSHLVIGMKVLTYNAAFDTFVLKLINRKNTHNNMGLPYWFLQIKVK